MARPLDGIHSIEDFELEDKRVFLRLDLNVPLKNGEVSDDTRIQAALPTICYAIEKGAKIVLASHFGRPSGSAEDLKKFSLEPVAFYLGNLIQQEVILLESPASEAPKALLAGLPPGQVLMLENLRFDPREEKNAHDFAMKLASYTDIYINDAFGASHRAHASLSALPQEIEKKGVGFLMKKEIEMLDRVRAGAESPYVAVMGGSKVSDKIEMIELLLDKVDTLIVGGAMAYTFLAAQKIPTGKSLVEKAKVSFCESLIERMEARGKNLLLPVDHLVVDRIDSPESARVTDGAGIPDEAIAVDIGPKTIRLFSEAVKGAKTVFWNGPMGIFETPRYSKGSFGLAEALSESSAISIVGGGDSAAAANASGFAKGMTHISTGGGAGLEFIQGAKLPGLEALRDKKRSEK